MESKIEWQKGEPNHDGYYIVTYILSDGRPFVTSMFRAGYHWYTPDGKRLPEPELVIAWFRMSDIQPYREKEDKPLPGRGFGKTCSITVVDGEPTVVGTSGINIED